MSRRDKKCIPYAAIFSTLSIISWVILATVELYEAVEWRLVRLAVIFTFIAVFSVIAYFNPLSEEENGGHSGYSRNNNTTDGGGGGGDGCGGCGGCGGGGGCGGCGD